MAPAFAPILFGFLLSGLMSLIVSGVSTVRVLGFIDGILWAWMANWLPSWSIAFPTVLLVAPVVRKIVNRLITEP